MSQRPKLHPVESAEPEEPVNPMPAVFAQVHEKRERMLAALGLACSVSMRRAVADLRLYKAEIDAGYASLYWFEALPSAPDTAPAGDINAHLVLNFTERFGCAPHEAALKIQIAHDAINVGIVKRPEIDQPLIKEVEDLPEGEA